MNTSAILSASAGVGFLYLWVCRLLKQIENGSAEERDPSKLENTEQLAEKAESH